MQRIHRWTKLKKERDPARRRLWDMMVQSNERRCIAGRRLSRKYDAAWTIQSSGPRTPQEGAAGNPPGAIESERGTGSGTT
jgi:hypothetical protein